MYTKPLTAGLLVALAAGCASMPESNDSLDRARSAVQAAEADPNVATYAALELDTAKKDLAQAEAANQHHQVDAIAQPAYMAAQTAKLAQLRAAAKADDARVAAGQAERDRIQLQASTQQTQNEKTAKEAAGRRADAASQTAEIATRKSAALQAELDALQAKPTERGLVLTLGDVLFDTGKAELNSGAARKLDRLVQFLNDQPDRNVEIDGFTDSVGADTYNLDLSQRRADAVRSALIGRGIDASRIGSKGYGENYAVASNDEASGRQLNRRVEVVIGAENGAAIAARP
jgi:outer membrane protein OmpA-like peptidoglycan-associated protein